jgi:hypothetical protein
MKMNDAYLSFDDAYLHVWFWQQVRGEIVENSVSGERVWRQTWAQPVVCVLYAV